MLKYCHLLLCWETKLLMGSMDGGAHAAGEDNLEAKFHRRFALTQAGARLLFVALNVPFRRRRTLDNPSPKKEKRALHPPRLSLCNLSTAISLLS